MKHMALIMPVFFFSFIVAQENQTIDPLYYYLDFDTSLGRTDRVFRSRYTKLLRRLQNKNDQEFLNPNFFDSYHTTLSLLRRHFDRNKVLLCDIGLSHKIPKIIHQIWLRSDPIPYQYTHSGRKHGNPSQAGSINFGQIMRLPTFFLVIRNFLPQTGSFSLRW